MFQTKVTFSETQTPEQRKAHADYWRRHDARKRDINNALGFWRLCGKPLCRRSRTCSDDMHACFERQWALIPEAAREYVRGCIKAARNTHVPDEIHRAGMAAGEDYLRRMDLVSAQPAPDAAPGDAEPAPDVRIRRL